MMSTDIDLPRPDYADDAEWAYLAPILRALVDDLARIHPAAISRPVPLRTVLSAALHRAYQAGMHEAYRQLRTSDEAAAELGVLPRTVRKHARNYNIGWRVGRDILFRPEDMERLRGIVGRPPGPRPRGAAQ
ncbi:MAG: hypothetical protein IRY92_02305 [Dactylosporangium sp.]|nr:hypothetical protein [Dactylosporangium sp.]